MGRRKQRESPPFRANIDGVTASTIYMGMASSDENPPPVQPPSPDPSPDPSPASIARRLIRSTDRAVLSTLDRETGAPYGSLVMVATDMDGNPILLISDLAEHTRNARADDQVSLLYDGTGGLDSPLTGARATVVGRLEQTEDESAIRRYLARHPDAEGYAGFGDFNFFRCRLERVHLVAGFGAIHWLENGEILRLAPADLATAEADIVEHMNADHADAVDLYASHLAGRDGTGWRMTGIDPDGFDLRLGGSVARIDFDPEMDLPIGGPDAARRALVRLVQEARSAN